MKLFIFLVASVLLLAANDKNIKTQKLLYTFNQKEINSAIKEHLPHSIDYMYIFNIKLLKAETRFLDKENRLVSAIDSNVSMFIGTIPKRFEAKITMSSGIHYVTGTESLYLNKPKIENIIIKDIDAEYTNMANSAISSALLAYYKKYPVYVLSAEDKKEIGRGVKNVVIKDKTLVVTLNPKGYVLK